MGPKWSSPSRLKKMEKSFPSPWKILISFSKKSIKKKSHCIAQRFLIAHSTHPVSPVTQLSRWQVTTDRATCGVVINSSAQQSICAVTLVFTFKLRRIDRPFSLLNNNF